MSLHEGEGNQSSSYRMMEVPLEAVAVGKDVGNKDIEEEEKIVGEVASHQDRNRKLTEKGRSLKLSTLSSTRKKMNSKQGFFKPSVACGTRTQCSISNIRYLTLCLNFQYHMPFRRV